MPINKFESSRNDDTIKRREKLKNVSNFVSDKKDVLANEILNTSQFIDNFDKDFIQGLIVKMKQPEEEADLEDAKFTLQRIIEGRLSLNEQTIYRTWIESKDFNRLKAIALSAFEVEREDFGRFIYELQKNEDAVISKAKSYNEQQKLLKQQEMERQLEEEKKRAKGEEYRKLLTKPVVFAEKPVEEVKEKKDTLDEDERACANMLADLVAFDSVVEEEKFKDDSVGRMKKVLGDHAVIITKLLNQTGNNGILASFLKKINVDKAELKDGEKSALTDSIKDRPSNTLLKFVDSLRSFVLDKKNKANEGENRIIDEKEEITVDDVKMALSGEAAEDTEALKKLDALVNTAVDDTMLLADVWIKSLSKYVEMGKGAKDGLAKVILDETTNVSVAGKSLYSSVLMDYCKFPEAKPKKRYVSDLLRKLQEWVPVDEEKNKDEYIEEGVRILDQSDLQEGPFSEEYMWEWDLSYKSFIPQFKTGKYKQKNDTHLGTKVFDTLTDHSGPVFQKSVQGVKLSPYAPKDFTDTVQKTRSKLKGIPAPVVEAKLNSIIDKSGGKITNILVEKSLGAATIGEAFLCRLFGPEPDYDVTGKLVVIKLLRPDIKSRFESEKPAIKNVAKQIDNTLGTDKKGQAERLLEDKLITTEQEMDFIQEEKNCEAGEIYNNQAEKEVRSVKALNDIKSDGTFIALEYVDGMNAGDLKSDLLKTVQKVGEDLSVYYKKDYAHAYEEDEEAYRKMDETLGKATFYAEQGLGKLYKLSKVWLNESLKGSGFYHADLHDGNIMVNDKEAVFIDFGNAKKLSKDQQANMKEMLKAVQKAARVEDDPQDEGAIFDSFTKALFGAVGMEPAGDKLALVKEVWDKVSDTIKKGDYSHDGDTSIRFFEAVMLMLKNRGFEIPVEVENYAKTLSQLANTVNEFASSVDKAKKPLSSIATRLYQITRKDETGAKYYRKDDLDKKTAKFDDILKEFLEEK